VTSNSRRSTPLSSSLPRDSPPTDYNQAQTTGWACKQPKLSPEPRSAHLFVPLHTPHSHEHSVYTPRPAQSCHSALATAWSRTTHNERQAKSPSGVYCSKYEQTESLRDVTVPCLGLISLAATIAAFPESPLSFKSSLTEYSMSSVVLTRLNALAKGLYASTAPPRAANAFILCLGKIA
jgi:hypothetical protein